MAGQPDGLELIKKSLSRTEANIEFDVPHVFVVLGASVNFKHVASGNSL